MAQDAAPDRTPSPPPPAAQEANLLSVVLALVSLLASFALAMFRFLTGIMNVAADALTPPPRVVPAGALDASAQVPAAHRVSEQHLL